MFTQNPRIWRVVPIAAIIAMLLGVMLLRAPALQAKPLSNYDCTTPSCNTTVVLDEQASGVASEVNIQPKTCTPVATCVNDGYSIGDYVLLDDYAGYARYYIVVGDQYPGSTVEYGFVYFWGDSRPVDDGYFNYHFLFYVASKDIGQSATFQIQRSCVGCSELQDDCSCTQ